MEKNSNENTLQKNSKKRYILINPPLYEVLVDYDFPGYKDMSIKELFLKETFSSHLLHAAGLLRIGAYLKAQGHEVSLINCLMPISKIAESEDDAILSFVKYLKCGNYDNEHLKHRQIRIGLPEDEIRRKLKESAEKNDPDEIFITSYMTYHYRGVYEAVRLAKEIYPNAKVTVGGIYPSLCPEHAKKSGADDVFKGLFCEAEDYPADYTLLDDKPNYAIIKMSRGCPKNCDYCAVHILEGNKMRFRDIKLVCEEIKERVTCYGLKDLSFWESNILVDAKNFFEKILDYIIAEIIPYQKDLSLYFPEALDPMLMYPELMRKMRLAGAKRLVIPLESADEKLLASLHRKTNYEHVKKAVEICIDEGYRSVDIDVYVLAGIAGQTFESILDSCMKVWELGCVAVILLFTPIPGTKEYIKNAGLLKKKDLEELHLYLFPMASPELPACLLRQLLMLQKKPDPIDFLTHFQLDPRIEDYLVPKLISSKRLMDLHYKLSEKGISHEKHQPDYMIKKWTLKKKLKGRCLEIGSGFGQNIRFLSKRCGISADGVEMSRYKIEKSNLMNGSDDAGSVDGSGSKGSIMDEGFINEDFVKCDIEKNYDTIFDLNYLVDRSDVDITSYMKKVASLLNDDGTFLMKIYSEHAMALPSYFSPGTLRKKAVFHTFLDRKALESELTVHFSSFNIIEHKKEINGESKPFIYEIIARK
ncbi:MAG: radical SAM protein [bacterium]|nr:radical SAM protein [bacterium]